MRLTVSKLVALGIAVAYAVLLVTRDDADASRVFEYCIGLMLALALIWFPEQIGEFTGYVCRGGNIDVETPPFLVSQAGWFFLVGLPLLTWWVTR